MNNRRLLFTLFGVLALHCSVYRLSGGSTDTELGVVVVGMVHDEAGRQALHTRVALIPQRYNPVIDAALPDGFVDSTDSMGGYAFKNVPRGAYTIFAAHQPSNRKLLITGIAVGELDTQSIRPDTLRETGALAIESPDQIDTVNGYIYIPGTLFFARASRHCVIDGIPPVGVLSVNYTDRADTSKNYAISGAVHITAGDTSLIADCHAWSHSGRIFLNTTAAGADVSGTVARFPVLVRLSSANFDFSQAQADGRDLRFTKSDGSPLPFEIEQWNPAMSVAEIWVKADTVYGNDSSHYFLMYWGNPGAAASSSPEAVFDTADGFMGVWHLAGAGNAIARDATPHHYDGTPTDTPPQPTQGVIGGALQFDGKGSGLVMKNTGNSPLNFPRPGTYTFSAWVYVDSVYDEDEFIAGKGHDQYALRVKGGQSVPANMFALHEYIDAPVYGTDMRYTPVVTQQWKFIVGIRDTAKSYLFIDGACVDSTGMIFSGWKSVQDSTSFSIGRCGAPFNGNDYLPFKGKIDEVRIAGVSCSADWVKLCYMNQKAGDVLLK